MVLFAGYRRAYSDMCAGSAENTGSIYIAYIDDAPAGVIFTEADRNAEKISYAFTKPEFRRSGVMTELIRAAADGAGKPVEAAVVTPSEDGEIVVHTLLGCGFKIYRVRRVYMCSGPDLWDKWNAFMQKCGNGLLASLGRQGYSSVSFADAGDEILRQIYYSDSSDYRNSLNYKIYFDDMEKRMSAKESMAAIKDGKVMSYTIVLRPDISSAVFRNLSTASDAVGSGLIFMPIAAAMRAIQESGCKRISYSMDLQSEKSNRFRVRILAPVTTHSKTVTHFRYMGGL